MTETQQRQAKTIAVAELMRLFVYELRWESCRIVGELGAKITQKRMRYELLLPWEDSAAGEKTNAD